ncbi:MAG TPA: 23S rRNA (adenine(2503)-C(2))-methyltransferase RlmN [Candidatus Binatia bacterium]|nr:23S rRNA (adenine(2503)-C(2))-methyltransferase RlmN [Candidatus Binatia bacterium]
MSQSQHTELLGLSIQELSAIAENLGEAAYRARQLFDGLYRQRWSSLEQFTTLSLGLRRKLTETGYAVGLPQIQKKFVSSDGTVRYLLAFADGESVETVWMPEGDGGEAGDGSLSGDEELATGRTSQRATICVSSQVGCAVDCAFCMTALLGLRRNLTAGEIVGQVLAVLRDQQAETGRDRVNLVFMGQGEPFLNYDNFMQAVRLLVEGVDIPESRMTVSTSGIVPRIADFAAEPMRPKLAISLNAPSEQLRTGIMPITKKWTIEKLMAALREFPLRNRERLTFEYVLLAGVNDDEGHAREVAELIRGLRAKVNLIALNAGPGIPFATPSDERVLGFQNVLLRAGIPTFIRRPRGRDIYAACGQLRQTAELVPLQP